MRKAYSRLLFCCLMFCMKQVYAQPYLDLVNARLTSSPDAGLINRNEEALRLNYYNISTTIPLLFKNKKDAIILSPFVEKWQFRLIEKNKIHHYYGMVFPVSFLKQVKPNWSILLTGIIRMNDSVAGLSSSIQPGGALIANIKKRDGLTFKFGVYVNGEFFGLFVMPLLGIDWQITAKDCVFGVLPGSLTYQHTVSKNWTYGFAFRAQTNSYKKPAGKYTRIDENQLGGFADFYVTKNIVLNLEAGHSLFRKIRTNQVQPCSNGNCDQKYNDLNVNDNIYFKLALAYRLSLR